MERSLSVVRFDVAALDDQQTNVQQVVPIIDGRSLVEIVTSYERAHKFEPSGGYGGLVPRFLRIGDLDRYYLGQQEPWVHEAVAVLACTCGEFGCWPLHVRVIVTDDQVTWHDFAQPHRPQRDYTAMGEFTFDRRQYQGAVRNVTEVLGREA